MAEPGGFRSKGKAHDRDSVIPIAAPTALPSISYWVGPWPAESIPMY